MKCIIQHNFTSGWGDALFAMTDYLTKVNEIKKHGFNIELNLNLRGNLYFKSKTPLDYLDNEVFSIFDKISINSEIMHSKKQNGYNCVFTFYGAEPSQHYYDIFVEEKYEEFFKPDFNLFHFNMIGMVNNQLPKIYPKINKTILSMYDTFINNNNLFEYDAIYYRTEDLQEHLDFLEKNKIKLSEIISNAKNLFICSNSKEFKKYVKSLNSKNIYFWEIPLEEEWGGNHLIHQSLEDDILHQRNIYTFLDMWTLGFAKNIHFFTTYGRYSNFLFYSPINKSNIIFH